MYKHLFVGAFGGLFLSKCVGMRNGLALFGPSFGSVLFGLPCIGVYCVSRITKPQMRIISSHNLHSLHTHTLATNIVYN